MHQVEDEPGGAEAHEVAVSFDEAGYGEASIEVDHLRFRADVRLDLPIAAHGHDPSGRRRQSGGLGERFVQRDDPAIPENELRRVRLPFARALGLRDAYIREDHQRQGERQRGQPKHRGVERMSLHFPAFLRS